MATHTTVVTLSGATYLLRRHGERTYVTSRGSSTGNDLTNVLLEAVAPVVGERMLMRTPSGLWLRATSTVCYWEATDVLTRDTVTSHDDVPFMYDLKEAQRRGATFPESALAAYLHYPPLTPLVH